MFRFKYPVDSKPYSPAEVEAAPYIAFDLERLNRRGLFQRTVRAVSKAATGAALSVLQVLAPRLKIGRLLILTRYDDVVAVLNDDRAFSVPFNPEMTRLARGATFMLGLDGEEHKCQRGPVQQQMTPERIAAVAKHADEVAAALLANSGGRIDVIRDYFARISTECVCRLLGMEPEDPDRFGDWTFAVSALLFGDPFGSPVIAELADHGAWRLRGVADHAIAQADEAAASEYNKSMKTHGNLLTDLLSDQISKGEKQWSAAELRALLIGIATGATPTMTLLAGNILEWLLDRPKRWAEAVAAAKEPPPAEGGSRLRLILLEAARFAPALDPGQFRLTRAGARLPNATRDLPKDTVVLAATATALMDKKPYPQPKRFDPDRKSPAEFLVFGAMPHRCLGRELAEQQLEIMFRHLLCQPGLARARRRPGKMHRVGPFPNRLELTFDDPQCPRDLAMVTILVPAPAATGQGLNDIEQAIGRAESAWQAAMDRTGIVHFASLSLIGARTEEQAKEQATPQLLVELTANGSVETCLAAMEREAGPLLTELLARIETPVGDGGLQAVLEHHRLKVHRKPWGAIGLDFDGQPGFSVKGIADARNVARFATDALDAYLRASQRNQPRRPMDAVRFVRGLIHGTVRASLRPTVPPDVAVDIAELALIGPELAAPLWRPGRETLSWVNFERPGRLAALGRFLASRDALALWLAVGLLFALIGFLILMALWPLAALHTHAGIVILAISAAIVLTLAFLLSAGVLFWRALRRLERRDWPDGRDPSSTLIQHVAERESRADGVQNHFISLSRLKSGPIRRLTFALSMWGIKQTLTYAFPKGFASDIGTIHSARWVRVPQTNQLLFTANYDGSWESYLEDFITLANEGQTAAWSNAEGFPPASNLTGGGAADGERFKRWVRLQQQRTGAWYSRYPELSMERIRRNAAILHGLAHAAKDSEARDWLALFGSRPPPADMVDLDDMQTILLSGHKKLTHGVCLLVEFPPNTQQRDHLMRTLAEGGKGIPPIAFGPAADTADMSAWAAFSADALRKLEVGEALATFDLPFQVGMEKRKGLLGFPDAELRWDDRAADFAYTLLATEHRLAAARKEAIREIKRLKGRIVAQVDLAPVDGDVAREPFGFQDGLSQPIIMAARPDRARLNPADVVAPGELLLGHAGNDGHVATPPRVQAERDPLGLLPDAAPPMKGVFPAFRDLGRHGSMVAIQEFEQDVGGFGEFCQTTAEELKKRYGDALHGIPVSADWLAARMVGRWKDGTPLVERPTAPGKAKGDKGTEREEIANDFGYATEDPMGFACPMGAHIRRANPRDALEPVGPLSKMRAGRHRILRRGRAWREHRPPEPLRQGLLFVGMCASLERQFEFIERSWLSAPNFASLEGETDPLLGPHPAVAPPGAPDAGRAGIFTIPTARGPIRVKNMQSFVTLKGGGYFFLPGRAAFAYLLWRMKAQARGADSDPLRNGLPQRTTS